MKRVPLTIGASVVAFSLFPHPGKAAGPFEKRLSSDRQIVHAINRLTFGPRPGDPEEVRRIGLNKWIELQLHPERIPENPILDEKLKPLETIRMSLIDVVKNYSPQQNMNMMSPLFEAPFQVMSSLPNEQRRKIQNGTAEERTAVLKSLDPALRERILASLQPSVIEFTPEYKEQAEAARKKRQDEIQAANRRMNPRLPDLLDADQQKIARTGTKEQIAALIDSFDPEKRARVAALIPPDKTPQIRELRREGLRLQAPRTVASEDAKEAKVFRAIYSNRQLEEVLVDFWTNHFNVDITKSAGILNNIPHVMIGSYERDAIRPHVFGHFRDLLLATARHPAMLYYLDNWESMAPKGLDAGPFAPGATFPAGGFQPFQNIAHGLNENYGREVMELHTLGVKGGYTQDDVINVARCFTGWTITSPDHPEFVFAPFMHDFAEKTVLGHKIPAGRGEQDGLDVIDILAHHPSTAKFISRELAQRFVADEPPDTLVNRMAQTFTKTDGDLRAVMETMFTSTEFLSEGAWDAKIKSPFETVVSTVRAMGADATDALALVQRIADMGEPLYSKSAPNGYPNTGEMWLSAVGVVGRMNFPGAVATDKFPGVTLDGSRWTGMDAPAIARSLLGHDASPPVLAALEEGLHGKELAPPVVVSLILGSPDFQRR